jgi:hypothetical protein
MNKIKISNKAFGKKHEKTICKKHLSIEAPPHKQHDTELGSRNFSQ